MSLTRDDRLADSARKIRDPFELDPTLRFYSPQENLDGLEHPRVAPWHDWIKGDWQPPAADDEKARIALMIPCTKYKPYSTSREHRAINGALLAAGWEPAGESTYPEGLVAVLDEGESRDLLHDGPLRRDGVYIDRFVMSEPLGLVPYANIYYWDGGQSPATSYDDPGLFESRGTSVSPERDDCTAEQLPNGKWKWGPCERDAYVETHNRLADVIGIGLTRIAPRYRAMGAWVSPGLTHRSFLADSELRKAEGLPLRRTGVNGMVTLRGVLDDHPGLVEVMPTQRQLEAARVALAKRLEKEGRPATESAVRGIYARGDGNDTPLGLPESLEFLVSWLDRVAVA